MDARQAGGFLDRSLGGLRVVSLHGGKAMKDYGPYTLDDIPELPFAEVEHRIYATVCEVERLKALVAAMEAKAEPTFDASVLFRTQPRILPKLQALFARKPRK